LPTDVEEYKEEVGCDKPEESINFRDGGLLLQVVQQRVLRELQEARLVSRSYNNERAVERGRGHLADVLDLGGGLCAYLLINLADMGLGFVLKGRHDEFVCDDFDEVQNLRGYVVW
jgi:hypothetical protein